MVDIQSAISEIRWGKQR